MNPRSYFNATPGGLRGAARREPHSRFLLAAFAAGGAARVFLFEVGLCGELGELPHLRPVDAPLVAPRELVEEDAAELLALALEHELLGVGPGRLEEAE